ncbi:secreted phosphoprotein 2, isoform CRA_a [Mus musculus]|nr:secreted phosphoprotein 2, isoform CRA_a [Mus musculus]
MEQAMLKTLALLVLGMHYWCATGFPVYDYDPSSLQEALSASVAKVNSQSLSPYLCLPKGLLCANSCLQEHCADVQGTGKGCVGSLPLGVLI